MSLKRVARRLNYKEKNLYYEIQSFGLCNQLFCLACGLANGSVAHKSVVIRGIYPDMTSLVCVHLDVFIDLEATNRNLAPIGTKLLQCEKGVRFHHANMFATSDTQRKLQETCLQAIVFSQTIREIALNSAPKEPFYALHFRLDVDAVLFYCAGVEVYQKWINLTNQNQEKEAREIVSSQIEIHKQWIINKITQYADAVLQNCTQNKTPIYVLTAIGKKNIHLGQNDLVEWAFSEFEKKVAPHALVRNSHQLENQGREYFAAIELCIACLPHSIGFIASSGSTFSETIKLRIGAQKLVCVV